MLPPDQLRLAACLFISVPLSYVLCLLRKAETIILVSCVMSVIMQLVVFQQEAPLLWLQQCFVYFICKYGKRSKVGKIVLLETFGVLITIQLRRMYLSYAIENIDITAILMMQAFLYIGFAYNYQDGELGKDHKRITERTIFQLPSFKQFMGFALFIPSCLVGPAFEFNDYINYIHRKGIYEKVTKGFGIPGMVKQSKSFVITFTLFVILLPLKISYMASPQYAEMNYFMQFLYLTVCIIGTRCRYYCVWSMGMIAVNATGITYNPIKKQDGTIQNKWDRIVVSDIWTFEMDPSMKKKADAWNIPIQLALKRYIYDRHYVPSDDHTPKQKKKLQIMAQQKTLAVSALWHGLYPGYYVSFFHWGLILQVSQQFYRIQKNSPKVAYWRKKLYYVQLIFINYILGFFGTCFLLMTWENIILYFKAVHFIPVIITYILNIVIVRLGVFSKHPKKQNITKEL